MVQDKHIFIYTDSWDTKIEEDALLFPFSNIQENGDFSIRIKVKHDIRWE